MKTVKNKKILLAIAMALVLSLSVGMTFAYFSGHTAAKGEATVALGGKTEIVEKVSNAEKIIGIKNLEDTDVLVRVGIFGPSTMSEEDIKYNENDWVKKNDGFYYYRHILSGKASTESNITAAVRGPEGEVENFDVVVVNECVPVTYQDGSIYIPDDWAKDFLSSNQ